MNGQGRRNPDVIDVFFLIKGGGVGHVASIVIGDNGHVVAHLILVWITEKGIEGAAHRDIGRPGVASVGTVGIK